jgi:tetratricopeptide (TPR) repeat protein
MEDVYARYREALRLGHQEAAEGRFAQALAQYQVAAEAAPGRALPLVAIGGMQLRLSRPREALAAYDAALQAESGNIDALSGRIAALLAMGRRDEAARVQQQIVALRGPGEAPADTGGEATPMSRADTLHVAGDAAKARGDSGAAIDAWLAEAAEHASAGRLDAALDAALGALSLDPGSPRIHLELSRLYFRRGWIDKGVERALLLDRLLTLEPDPQIHAQLRELAAEHAAADGRLIALARRPA